MYCLLIPMSLVSNLHRGIQYLKTEIWRREFLGKRPLQCNHASVHPFRWIRWLLGFSNPRIWWLIKQRRPHDHYFASHCGLSYGLSTRPTWWPCSAKLCGCSILLTDHFSDEWCQYVNALKSGQIKNRLFLMEGKKIASILN